jgi:hypothetical protein
VKDRGPIGGGRRMCRATVIGALVACGPVPPPHPPHSVRSSTWSARLLLLPLVQELLRGLRADVLAPVMTAEMKRVTAGRYE